MQTATMQVDVYEHRLGNGLQVFVAESHEVPVVSLWAFYRVGSRHEHLGITGISHWVEHMLFKGTPKFPKGVISKLIQKHGGTLNGHTSYDHTAYFETLPAENIDIAFEIESDRMKNALFDPEETELERGVILSELEMIENHPEHHLFVCLAATAYQVHPYRNPIIGWRSDLESMTREQLFQHYRTFYSPRNAFLVVSGAISAEAALKKAEQFFGDIEPVDVPPAAPAVEPPQKGERRVKVRGHGESPLIAIAFHIPPHSHEDNYPLRVAATLLSHGRSSRLYQALVETKKVISVSANAFTAKDGGMFLVQAQLINGVPLPEVEGIILSNLERLKKEPPSQDELEKAKNQQVSGFVFSIDSVTERAYQIGVHEIMGGCSLLNIYLDKIQAVTSEQIQQTAQRYLTEDNRTVGWFEPVVKPELGG